MCVGFGFLRASGCFVCRVEVLVDVGEELEAGEVFGVGCHGFGLDGLEDLVDFLEGFSAAEVGFEEAFAVGWLRVVQKSVPVCDGQLFAFLLPQGNLPVDDAAPSIQPSELALDDVELGAFPASFLGAEAVALVVFTAVENPALGGDLACADLVAAKDVRNDLTVVARVCYAFGYSGA